MQSSISGKFSQWLDRRIPKSKEITLSQRSIFVFPTKAGMHYVLLLCIILLTAINYQNSMIYMLVFFLVVLFILTILLSFQNLYGLTIAVEQVDNVYLGEMLFVNLVLRVDNSKPHFQIIATWVGESEACTSVSEDEAGKIQLTLMPNARGVFKAKRLLIETIYPFGLIRAWTWLDLDVQALVYPSPIKGNPTRSVTAMDSDGEQGVQKGMDDFHSLREYVPGDSLKHVAWKQFAKQGTLLTKEFESPLLEPRHFSLADYASVNLENALSNLCYDIVDAHGKGELYAMSIPGWTSDFNNTPGHLEECLSRLALYSGN